MGATTTFIAGWVSARTTVTFSPMLTPALERIIPSMEMIPLPSSSLEARNTLAAVLRFPTISMKSPHVYAEVLSRLCVDPRPAQAYLGLMLSALDLKDHRVRHATPTWPKRKDDNKATP